MYYNEEPGCTNVDVTITTQREHCQALIDLLAERIGQIPVWVEDPLYDGEMASQRQIKFSYLARNAADVHVGDEIESQPMTMHEMFVWLREINYRNGIEHIHTAPDVIQTDYP